jgi:hypothetical protein
LRQTQHDPPVKHCGMPPHTNAFDSELVTIDLVELDDATLANVNHNGREERPGNNASDLSRRESIVPRNGETVH